MNYIEYGKENREAIILLHGGGLSWWNYREAAEILQKDYHVILPILDGHSGCEQDFTTIKANAVEIIQFIDERLNGSVLLIGGLSLGGQILLEILSLRKNICQYAVVESALVIPSKLRYSMIKPAFGNCYGLVHYKWFSKLQFKTLRLKSDLFEDYYRDTCSISKARKMFPLLRTCTKAAISKNWPSNTLQKTATACWKQKLQTARLHW